MPIVYYSTSHDSQFGDLIKTAVPEASEVRSLRSLNARETSLIAKIHLGDPERDFIHSEIWKSVILIIDDPHTFLVHEFAKSPLVDHLMMNSPENMAFLPVLSRINIDHFLFTSMLFSKSSVQFKSDSYFSVRDKMLNTVQHSDWSELQKPMALGGLELLQNAFFSAPVAPNSTTPINQDFNKDEELVLLPPYEISIYFGKFKPWAYFAVEDPFGTHKRAHLIRHFAETSQALAGKYPENPFKLRGSSKVLYSCTHTFWMVEKGKSTTAFMVWNQQSQSPTAQSLHYYQK